MKLRSWLVMSILALAAALSACGSDDEGAGGGGAGGSGGSGPKVLASIRVSPATVSLAAGETQQLTVSAQYTDGSGAAVTSGVSFASDAEAVATVSASGLVTAVAEGSATVTATYSGKSATAALSVRATASPGEVFVDGYADGVSFAPFGGATNDVSVVTSEHHSGTSALQVVVPAAAYTGGALVADAPKDFSAFNALSFWVKGSKAAALNVTGLGNDAAGAANSAELLNVAVTTDWTRVIVPLPDPAKLTQVAGLFHFAEGSEEGAYTLWFDDIAYETLGAADLGAATAATAGWAPIQLAAGGTFAIPPGPNTVTFDRPAVTLTNVAFRWFDLSSSDEAVATVSDVGVVTAVASGSAEITAKLGTLDVAGSAAVTVLSEIPQPTTAPAAPTRDAADVISLLGTTYTNRTVDTWRADFGGSSAQLEELTIEGQPVQKYSSLNFVGVEFTANVIDATAMTGFHVDVWTPDITNFQVKLVDFGDNGVYDGGDDSEGLATIHAGTVPPLTGTGQWVSLDIPFTTFAGTWNRAHLAQLLFISGTGSGTAYVANVYFYDEPLPAAPDTAPAAPTAPATDVISLLSSVYTDVPVDTWRTDWSGGGLEELTIEGVPVKRYHDLAFVGVTFEGAKLIDASEMNYFHVDVWTPDITNFQVKLVDFGADGVYNPGVDDTEGLFTAHSGTDPALTGQRQWVSLDIPLSAFAGTWNRAHLAQLLFISGTGSGTAFVTNIYFHE